MLTKMIDMPLTKPSKMAIKKEVTKDINLMPSTMIVWYLVKKHKFGLLATFTFVYVWFSVFGRLTIGIIESTIK